MLKIFKKFKHAVARRKWLFITVSILLLTSIIAAGVTHVSLSRQAANIASKKQMASEAKKHEKQTDLSAPKDEPKIDTKEQQPAPAPTPPPKTTGAAPKVSQPTTPKKSAAPEPPMSVLYATVYGNFLCVGGETMSLTTLHSVTTSKPSDGTPINWQTEVITAGQMHVDKTGTTVIPTGQRNVQLQLTSSAMSTVVGSGAQTRLHITGPNNVVSPWYTAPKDIHCAYQNY